MDVTDILDLRDRATLPPLGLTADVLRCPTDDSDGYSACQRVSQVAHQLGLHGLIAPAATGLGHTLALFIDLLPTEQRPVRAEADQIWNGLPPDPRVALRPDLKIVRDTKQP